MYTIPLLAAGAAASVLYEWFTSRKVKDNLKCSWIMTVSLPVEYVRERLNTFMVSHGFKPRKFEDSVWVFERGDESIDRIPTRRDVRWREVPILLAIHVMENNGQARAEICFASYPTVTYSEIGERFFKKQAEAEFDAALEYMKSLVGDFHRRRSDCNDRQRATTSAESDYEALGLKPGASWRDVQAAFRNCSKQFHPDYLNGANVAPHLVELALRRFKEMSAAYQRIKELLESTASSDNASE